MRIEFAYAQARAQARNGARLGDSDWRVLESGRTQTQFLYAARATALAPHLAHLTADTPPHAIERSLRRDWRALVAAAASWVPKEWRRAIEWTAQLPDLPAQAYLAAGGGRLDWMQEDSALASATGGSDDALPAAAAASGQPENSRDAVLADWLRDWRHRWPSANANEIVALEELAALLREHRDARRDPGLTPERVDKLAGRLQQLCVRLLRRRRQQPAAVFCHLALAGMDLWRLRAALMRRAIVNGVDEATA